jgi:cytochrome c
MKIHSKDKQKKFSNTVSAGGCAGLGVAAFALGIMFFSSQPSAARQSGPEKGDVKRGQEVFEKRCTGCHSLDQDKEGPKLRGVFGRKAGTLSGTFEYSDALKASNVTWDAASLNQWMADPEKIVPKSNMFFRVPKIRERADVIAYLQELADR